MLCARAGGGRGRGAGELIVLVFGGEVGVADRVLAGLGIAAGHNFSCNDRPDRENHGLAFVGGQIQRIDLRLLHQLDRGRKIVRILVEGTKENENVVGSGAIDVVPRRY